jgi:hypothetical protein
MFQTTFNEDWKLYLSKEGMSLKGGYATLVYGFMGIYKIF